MPKFFLLILFVVSLSSQAALKLNNYEYYRANPSKAKADFELVSKMKLDAETKGLALDTFRELDKKETAFLKFDNALDMAKNRHWANISKMLEQVSTSCKAIGGTAFGSCEQQINDLKDFIKTSNLGEESRSEILSLLENGESNFNLQLDKYNSLKLKLDENLSGLNLKIGNLEKSLFEKEVLVRKNSEKMVVAQEQSNQMYLLGIFLASAFSLAIIISFYYFQNRKVKNFYSKIFFHIKKNNSKTKVFGQIKMKTWRRLKVIEKVFLDILICAKGNLSFRELKFKSNKLFYIVELNFSFPISLSSFLSDEDQSDFSLAVNSFKEKVEQVGGELIVQMSFNHIGEISHSKMVAYIPKKTA